MALTKITSDVIGTGAIESTHIASGAISSSHLTGITTDNVSEGSSNTYFTNARARASVSVTGGNLTYDNSTGVLQLTNAAIEGAISTLGDISTGNITTTGYLRGPATFTIDPAAHGNNTGTLVIAGNLQVDGTTTTINSTTMTVDDLNLTLASGAANAAAANGAGLTVDGASATIIYDGTNDEWDFNKGIHLTTPALTTARITAEESSGATTQLSSGGTTGYVGTISNHDLLIRTNSFERIRIENSGAILLNDNLLSWYSQSNTTYNNANLRAEDFYFKNAGNTTRMFIDGSTGRIGIGSNNTSPDQLLDISGSGEGLNLQGGNNRIYFSNHRALEGAANGSLLQVGEGFTDISLESDVGIATSSPDFPLDVNGVIQSRGILNFDNEAKSHLYCNFVNGVANANVDIYIGNVSIWGYIEVEITGTYSNQNTAGKLTKVYAVGTNPNNAIYLNKGQVTSTLGTIKDNIALGDFYWDSTNSRYAIRVSHIVSTGNDYTIKVRFFTHQGSSIYGARAAMANLGVTSVYTATALGRNYINMTEGPLDRVGIGETDPDRPLHVNSGGSNVVAKFESTDSVAAIEFTDPAGSAEIGNEGNDIRLMPAGSTRAYVTTSGNMHLQSESQCRLVLGSTGGVSINNATNWIRGSGGSLQFNAASSGYTWESGGSTRLAMSSTGVITQTTAGTSDSYDMILRSTDSGDPGLAIVRDSAVGFGIAVRASSDDYADLQVNSGGQPGYTEAGVLRLYHNNNVAMPGNHSYNVDDGLFLLSDTGRIFQTFAYNSAGAEVFLQNNRNVNGQVAAFQYRINNSSQSGGTIYAGTNGYTGGNFSDYRLKNNVANLTGSLDKINALRVVSYNHVDTPDLTELGVIAHEIQEVFPEFVRGEKDAVWTQEDIDNYEGQLPDVEAGDIKAQQVDYFSKEWTSHFIKAIQELKAENEVLKARIEALEG